MLKWQGLLALSFSVTVKSDKDSYCPLSLSWAYHLQLPPVPHCGHLLLLW